MATLAGQYDMEKYLELDTRYGLQGEDALKFAAERMDKDVEREERSTWSRADRMSDETSCFWGQRIALSPAGDNQAAPQCQYTDSCATSALRLSTDLYCDDLLTSLKTEEEADQFIQETRQIFSEAKMNMRKWASNRKLTVVVGGRRRV